MSRCPPLRRVRHPVHVETAPTQHSADGSWWWSGSEWVPAWSPDRRWWFDGNTWRDVAGARAGLSRFEKRLVAAWIISLVLACGWAVASGPHVTPDGLTSGWLVSGVAIFFGWLLGMAATGFLLTRRQRTRQLLVFVPVAWFMMGLWVAFLATMPIPGATDDDNGPAVGLVLMAFPGLAVLALTAGIGSAVAWLIARARERLGQVEPARNG